MQIIPSVMQHHDPHDLFAEIYNDPVRYTMPGAEKRELLERFEADNLWKLFNDGEKLSNLFNSMRPSVDVWETGLRNKFPISGGLQSATNLDAIRECFIRSENDPHIRHVFIGSRDSRSPMNCSPEMFRFICAYQQIEPFFLEAVFSFGKQSYPIDHCLAHFRSRLALERNPKGPEALPKIGRSGNAIQLSYLLRSVEHSGDGGIEGWQIRQAANYHSFDIETGLSFWLTIKANNVFKERIKTFTPHLKVPSEQSVLDRNISSYLKASLDTHLLYFYWCDEGWRDFINDFEASIRKIVLPAKTATVDDHIDPDASQYDLLPGDLRRKRQQRSMSYRISRGNTGLTTESEKKVPPTVKERAFSYGRGLFRRSETTKRDEEQGFPLQATATLSRPNAHAGLDPSNSLDRLRISDIQTLYSRSELVQKVLLVLELNIGVLRDAHAFYSNLTKTGLNDLQCKEVVDSFLVNLMSIMRRLETRRAQLSALSTHVTQCIQLYELVLQQRSNQIGMDFADVAHEYNRQTNMVADKTSRQTASMHVITVVTLIFLPATFVATFFQSGVLLRDDNTGTFSFKGKNFGLFSLVCGPLTTFTVGIWFFVYVNLRLKAKEHARVDGDQPLRDPVKSDEEALQDMA